MSDETYNADDRSSGRLPDTRRDEYQGWANRETWAFNLHWQNDHGLYLFTLDNARDYVRQHPEHSDRALGEHVVAYLEEELPELSPELWENMRSDVGSFWRIDHAETGAAVRESLGIED
jgi:hypothetical protein